jgi:hypothetical protein
MGPRDPAAHIAPVKATAPQAPAVSTLLPSLVKTVEPGFDYRVYLGYDVCTRIPPPPHYHPPIQHKPMRQGPRAHARAGQVPPGACAAHLVYAGGCWLRLLLEHIEYAGVGAGGCWLKLLLGHIEYAGVGAGGCWLKLLLGHIEYAGVGAGGCWLRLLLEPACGGPCGASSRPRHGLAGDLRGLVAQLLG